MRLGLLEQHLAVMVLISSNEQRVMKGLEGVATGPIVHGLNTIAAARQYFSNGWYFLFVVNYNLINCFSFVPYLLSHHLSKEST